MPVDIHRLSLSATKLRGLDAQARFVFASAGHIFNELMLLQKLVHVARRPPNVEGPVADASVGVAMFMLRTLVGKAYEAMLTLRKDPVSQLLRKEYFGLVDGLEQSWDAALDAAANLRWMSVVRNQGAFHYPNGNQLTPFLSDEYCEGAYVLIGRRYGDTYFHWAEIASALPALSAVNAADPMEGLAIMIEDVGRLLGNLTDCLAQGLQAYMKEHLVDEGEGLDDAVRIEAPDFDSFHLPYFFADERA